MPRSQLFSILMSLIVSSVLAQAPGSTTVLSGGERVSQADTISISVKNAELTDVLRMISRTAGLNLVLDDELHGKTVTLDLDDVPWDQALELVLKTHGLGSEWSGNVLQVGNTADMTRGLQQRAQLRELQEQSGGLVTVARTLANASAADAERLVSQHLSARGRVSLDRRTNTLIIQDSPAVIGKLTGLLEVQDAASKPSNTSPAVRRSTPVRGVATESWNSFRLQSTDSFVERLALPESTVRGVSGTPATLAWVQLSRDDLEVAKLLLGRLTEQGRLEVLEARALGLGPAGTESVELGPLGRDGGPLRLDLALQADGARFVLTFRCFRSSGGRLPLAWHGPTDAGWIVELQPAPGEPWRVLLITPGA